MIFFLLIAAALCTLLATVLAERKRVRRIHRLSSKLEWSLKESAAMLDEFLTSCGGEGGSREDVGSRKHRSALRGGESAGGPPVFDCAATTSHSWMQDMVALELLARVQMLRDASLTEFQKRLAVRAVYHHCRAFPQFRRELDVIAELTEVSPANRQLAKELSQELVRAGA